MLMFNRIYKNSTETNSKLLRPVEPKLTKFPNINEISAEVSILFYSQCLYRHRF